jgi:nucleoside-diphosphate-sugar epimerase
MIRWIDETLGTAAFDDIEPGPWRVLDVRTLVDKRGNPADEIRAHVEEGASTLRRGLQLVIGCDFGISRSNAIAAGVLANVRSISFDDALMIVKEATRETQIKLDLVETVRDALGGAAPSLARNRVLVTGGTGFIGRHLVVRLQENHEVVAPTHRELDVASDPLLLAEFCRRHEVGQIIHLAAPPLYTNANAIGPSILMLRNLVDVCRSSHVRLVLISGTVVFSGYASTSLSASETLPLNPAGTYGQAKYLEEALVDLLHRRGEIERTIVRLSNVYGPGGDRPRFIRRFYEAALQQHPIRTHLFRNGRPGLDLLYITDAVEALARVASHPEPGVFNVGTGTLLTTVDIAHLIADIAGVAIEVEEVRIDDDTGSVMFPSPRTRADLGWAPVVSTEAGLRATIDSFQPSRLPARSS